MMSRFFQWPDTKSQKRLRLAYHGVFFLLLAHFAMVHWMPGYFYSTRAGWSSALNGPPRQGRVEVIEKDGKRFLWGGHDPKEKFDITEFRLNPEQLHYGIGREAFSALIEPAFDSMGDADLWLKDGDRVLVLELGDDVRVYPIELLIGHEIVNDVVNGIPVFAAYCILADLGAIYERTIRGQTFTFGLSGHTYSDADVWDGMQVFVFWDRETESMWWPAIGKGVSGLMIDTPLPLLDESHWSQTDWADAKSRHREAKVLQPGQDFVRPTSWPQLTAEDLEWNDEKNPGKIAPRWGDNASVKD